MLMTPMNSPLPAPAPPRRLERARSALLVVDLQERLLPAMWEPDRVVRNVARLIRGSRLLQVPILATEQYRKGLGATVPELAEALAPVAPIEKLTFSGAVPEVLAALAAGAVRDVVLCGIETHVCVTQTALELLDRGYRVAVAADACSSRLADSWRIGLDRMQAAGALPASTEMVLFEWLERAGTPQFREILGLVK